MSKQLNLHRQGKYISCCEILFCFLHLTWSTLRAHCYGCCVPGRGGEVRGERWQCQCTSTVAVVTTMCFPPSCCCQAKEEQRGAVSQSFITLSYRWRPQRYVVAGFFPNRSGCERQMQKNKWFQTKGTMQIKADTLVNSVICWVACFQSEVITGWCLVGFLSSGSHRAKPPVCGHVCSFNKPGQSRDLQVTSFHKTHDPCVS